MFGFIAIKWEIKRENGWERKELRGTELQLGESRGEIFASIREITLKLFHIHVV